DEAAFVAEEVQRLAKADKPVLSKAEGGVEGLPLRGFAVMYRTNAQSRPLEEAFVRRNIPYRLVGGTRFYERREVKDLLAYLRLVHNPFDSVALMRIVNVPPRGIGDRTLAELTRWAGERNIPIYAALQLIADAEPCLPAGRRDSPDDSAHPARPPWREPVLSSAEGPVEGRADVGAHPFRTRTVGALLRFLGLANELIAAAKTASLSELLDTIIERTGYREHLLGGESGSLPDGQERWENVQELRTVANQYDELKLE
ncbi:unnamed protein product, partial [marine sediment metagenome]